MELEDGELDESDNEELQHKARKDALDSYSYRDTCKHDNSDSDSDSDYEGGHHKRGRSDAMLLSPVKKPFKNPLTRKSDMENWSGFIDKDNSESDFWKKGLLSASQAARNLRTKNNIWGDVLSDEALAGDIKSTSTGEWKASMNNERDVESYDYQSAKYLEERRPDSLKDSSVMDESEQITDNTVDEVEQTATESLLDRETFGKTDYVPKPRKRSLEKRDKIDMSLADIINHRTVKIQPPPKLDPGRKSVFTRLGTPKVAATNASSADEIIQYIVDTLCEENIVLIVRIVDVIGKERALKVLHETIEIEKKGGMQTMDNSRRRSPGGVFIQLVKSLEGITKAQIKQMLYADREFKCANKRKKKTKNTFDKALKALEADQKKRLKKNKKSEADGQKGTETGDEMDSEPGECKEEKHESTDDTSGKLEQQPQQKASTSSSRTLVTYDDIDFFEDDDMGIILE